MRENPFLLCIKKDMPGFNSLCECLSQKNYDTGFSLTQKNEEYNWLGMLKKREKMLILWELCSDLEGVKAGCGQPEKQCKIWEKRSGIR